MGRTETEGQINLSDLELNLIHQPFPKIRMRKGYQTLYTGTRHLKSSSSGISLKTWTVLLLWGGDVGHSSKGMFNKNTTNE